jgi:hypothetical protein
MRSNINRNSIHALKTTSLGWFGHGNIPNLSIGTDSTFTIQIYIVLGVNTDGVVYSQENGFTIQLVEGIPVFRMAGFATLAADAKWELSSNAYYYLTFRHDNNGILSMFINGIKVKETNTTAANASTGNFTIGQGLGCGFSMVRVSSAALTDERILYNNSHMPTVDDSCVFQTDCQTIQYKDVSNNNIPIWACGEGAKSCMYTACTYFKGNGYALCRLNKKIAGEHTLLLKIYPFENSNRQILYKVTDGDNIIYSIELVRKDDNGYAICVTDADKDVESKVELSPQKWQDVALTFSKGKIQIYLDGVSSEQIDFELNGDREMVYLGGEYNAKTHLPCKCFKGYMSYAAEFNRILSSEEICSYVDDSPFLFEEGLSLLMLFDWNDNIEYIGRTPISTVGGVNFVMASNTTPINTPVGVLVRFPQSESENWSKLSDEDKWCCEQYIKVLNIIYNMLIGYEMGTQMVDGDFVVNLNNLQNVPLEAIDESTLEFTTTQAEQYAYELLASDNAFLSIAQYTGIGARVTTFFGSCLTFLKENWVDIIGITAFGGLTIAAVVKCVKNAQKSRPKAVNSRFEVLSICWNNKGDPNSGSLHYHSGGKNLPIQMTDNVGTTELNTKCVLVPSLLGDNNGKVSIVIRYNNTDKSAPPVTTDFKVYDLEDETFLGGSTAGFTVSPGESVTVTLSYGSSKMLQGMLRKQTCKWQFCADNQYMVRCVCDVYTLANIPISPWITNIGSEYDSDEPGYLWTEMLDIYSTGGADCSDFAKYAVERTNSLGVKYDSDNGMASFVSFTNNDVGSSFWLESFVDVLQDMDSISSVQVNCTDCSVIVSTAVAMVGEELKLVVYEPGDGINRPQKAFECNPILSIGRENEGWLKPFGYGFSYHQFNVKMQKNTVLDCNSLIYDACLKVDGSTTPWETSDKCTKIPTLATGMKASLNDNEIVQVLNSLEDKVYRERLVSAGERCVFNKNYYNPEFHFSGMGSDKMKVQKKFSSRFAAIMEDFALNSLENTHFRYPDWKLNKDGLLDFRIIASEDNNYLYCQFKMDDIGYTLRYWKVDGSDQVANQLGCILMSTSNPSKRFGTELNIQIGDRCFVVGNSCIAFSRYCYVFEVTSDNLEHSKELARLIDNQVVNA